MNNSITVIGRVGGEIVEKSGKNGLYKVLSMVVSGRDPMWYKCIISQHLYSGNRENFFNSIEKGSTLWITGVLDLYAYMGKDDTIKQSFSIRVVELGFLPFAKRNTKHEDELISNARDGIPDQTLLGGL